MSYHVHTTKSKKPLQVFNDLVAASVFARKGRDRRIFEKGIHVGCNMNRYSLSDWQSGKLFSVQSK